MKAFKLLAALAAAIFILGHASAQNGTMTPYSRFGYGMLRDNATAAQQAMGGVGYGMNSGRQINVMNPASYSRMDSLTFLFDMGVDLSMMWQREPSANGELKDHQTGGGLNYITMQVPLAKRLGMSLGILPYSAVGYAFGNSIDNGYSNRQGTGSINQAYIGLGYGLGPVAVGVNAAYVFGSTLNDTYAITSGGSTSLYEDELNVRDWRFDIGLQYTLTMGRDYWTLGAVYSPQKALHGHLHTYAYDVDADSKQEDYSSSKLKDNFGIAATYGLGLNYRHDYKWMVEADLTYQPWSKVKYQGHKGSLNDRYKLAVGMQYQPALRGSYLKHIQYRLGAFANRDYLVVRGNSVREYGISGGFGFPVPGFKSVVNLGFEWIHRQAHPTPLIKENYFNITLGINFNEAWFFKNALQ